MSRLVLRPLVGGLVAASLLSLPAFAAGPYDGTWVVDVPAAGFIASSSNYRCPALRLPIQIKDNQVTGNLERVSTTTGAVVVEQGAGSASSPVTGTVQPDGSVMAQWENYHAQGRLGQQSGQVTIQGGCGPRTALAIRVTPSSTESAGSSTPPPTEELQGR